LEFIMNQQLQGWKLALALLIPVAIIGAAGFLVYGALSDDDVVAATMPTALETQTADPTTVPAPTPRSLPTPLTLPTAPAVAAVPVTPTVTVTPLPAQTTPPAPQPTAGPAPTSTPDPSIVTVACKGDIPGTVDTGQAFGPLTAVTVPAEAAAGYIFTWNLGNSTTQTSLSTSNVSYAEAGTYTITLAGNSAATGVAIFVTCATITVSEPVANLQVSCSVSPANSEIELASAKAGDVMRITTIWSPTNIQLSLQYEFEPFDDLIIINPAATGDSQTNAFSGDDAVFSVFWRYGETGEAGQLTCPAYPGGEVN
jgi:hypothetical protein